MLWALIPCFHALRPSSASAPRPMDQYPWMDSQFSCSTQPCPENAPFFFPPLVSLDSSCLTEWSLDWPALVYARCESAELSQFLGVKAHGFIACGSGEFLSLAEDRLVLSQALMDGWGLIGEGALSCSISWLSPNWKESLTPAVLPVHLRITHTAASISCTEKHCYPYQICVLCIMIKLILCKYYENES